MRSLNAMLCRFYGLPGADRGNADLLAHRAAECVANCKTRLVIVDDVHFLDMSPPRRARGRQPLQVAGQRLPGHVPVRRRRAARPRPARRGPGRRGRRVLPDRPAVERAVRRPVRDRHHGRARPPGGSCCWASSASLVLADAWRGMLAEDLSELPVRPLQRALRLADVADQPRLLPRDQDRRRAADRRPAGRRCASTRPPRTPAARSRPPSTRGRPAARRPPGHSSPGEGTS